MNSKLNDSGTDQTEASLRESSTGQLLSAPESDMGQMHQEFHPGNWQSSSGAGFNDVRPRYTRSMVALILDRPREEQSATRSKIGDLPMNCLEMLWHFEAKAFRNSKIGSAAEKPAWPAGHL
jgi:hypothetical protein